MQKLGTLKGFCSALESGKLYLLPDVLRALVMSERECFPLATIVFFDVIVAIEECVDLAVLKMKFQSSDSNSCWQRGERMWSIPGTEGVKHSPSQAVDRARKGKAMCESSILLPCESTISADQWQSRDLV